MTEYTKGQIVTAKTPEGESEPFEVVKVGRKYVYFESDIYGSDGVWRANKSDLSKVERY